MAFKKVARKSARPSAKPAESKDAACTCGASGCKCGCGCHRAKRIIVKAIILAIVVFASAKVAECMVMHRLRRMGPHMMEMKKGCDGDKGDKKGGFFRHNRGPRPEEKPTPDQPK
jgi:hypothetical protein